jgi:hypothetical protein
MGNPPSEEIPSRQWKKEMSTKSGFEGLPQEYGTRAALGGL